MYLLYGLYHKSDYGYTQKPVAQFDTYDKARVYTLLSQRTHSGKTYYKASSLLKGAFDYKILPMSNLPTNPKV